MSAPMGGLAILVDEKRVNDLLTQKSGAKAVLRSACNTILFGCFLALFTSLALSEPREKKRTFEGHLRRRFDTEADVPLADVVSIKSFWQFHNRSFMPGLYGKDTQKYYFPGAIIPKLLPIEGANRLYGVARMRAINIKPDMDCMVADQFQPYFPTCYGPFSQEAMHRDEFGPLDSEGQSLFRFRADPGIPWYNGQLSNYPPGGFMEAITSDYIRTYNNMRLMEKYGFISEKTRAIFIDFTVYNFNLGLYAVCRLVFEIAPGGDWTKTFEIDILLQRHLTALGTGSTQDWLILIGEAILVLFVLRYLLEEASEFLSCEGKGGKLRPSIKWDYFLDAWNVLDWANLLMMITTLGFRISTWSLAGGLAVFIGDPEDATVEAYSDLHGVAANIRVVHSLVAFNMILTWFKTVKYITIVPYVTTFMQSVTIAQRMLSSWIVVFCTSLIGFVLAFSTAFGGEVSHLQTPWKAFVFIMKTVLGNSEMKVIYDVSPLLGSLLLFMYTVGIFFVIMNLFYAIMVTTLSDAKLEEDSKQRKKWAQLADRLKDLWGAVVVQLKLDRRFRTMVPGLYSRVKKYQKKQEMKEKERDEAMVLKTKAMAPDALLSLGPGSPVWGRRTKRALATVAIEDQMESDSDEGSEPDLGPLKSQDQLYDMTQANMAKTFGSQNSFMPKSIGDVEAEATHQTTDEGIDLVIDATRHIAAGIVERSRGARNVLLAEMSESMEVLNNVGIVLEVLGKRARDLEAQQKQVLKNL
eukprot:TRINITY_DN78726_c0_g1_i1.p1 TRINITY_DN78726_c0_g1~~TRINITY_DN78726_c0_g1_i1.p1  ORF type:complete len:750 (+),score=160.84 TRINITY_DN78726_c0_g1_i1:64-2313(+)